MSDLVVLTFENDTKAGETLKALSEMQREHLIQLEDAAVAVKDANGKVKVTQTLERLVKGSNITSGGFWGLLIGLIFGGPLFGAVLGMGVSALFGRKLDIGVNNGFITDVANDLQPGESALFVLSRDMTLDKVSERLRQFGGNLHHTSLTREDEEALAQALNEKSVSEAAMAM